MKTKLRSFTTIFMLLLLVILSACGNVQEESESEKTPLSIDNYMDALDEDTKTKYENLYNAQKKNNEKKNGEREDGTISDDIRSYEIMIGDELFCFPMTHEELAETSWTYCGETPLTEATATPGIKYEAEYTNGTSKVIFNLINTGDEDTTADNTIVAGLFIQFDSEDALSREEVTLPANVSPTYADVNSLKSIYGEPSEVFHDNATGTHNASKLVYRTPSALHSYTIFVDNNDHLVREILILSTEK